jgi:hypothetical protein
MSCTRCGALITPGSRSCPACGKAVPPERVATVAPAPPASGAMRGYEPPASPLDAPAPVSPAVPQQINGFAVVSLVMGIIWYFWIGSILALIFGYIAKGQIDALHGRQKGRGFAVAGIVLGWVGIGIFVVVAIIAVIVRKPS